MSPIQQMLLGVGAVATKTYVDDILSTYLYAETGTTVTVNNGIDMSEGGMVWFKNREGADSHVLIDTVRGGTKVIHSNASSAESTQSGAITSFNNNGFAIGNYGSINGGSNKDVASWSFRKAPGFFTIKQYTGTGGTSARSLTHDLGSVPGFIALKKTSQSGAWLIYHRDLGTNEYLKFNNLAKGTSANDSINSADASQFTVGIDHNDNNETYIAYLWAGGESTAATARSVAFSSTGSNDGAKSLTIANSSDTDLGSGDFTLECWFKDDAGIAEHDTIFALENYGEGGSDSGPGNSFSCYVHTSGIKIFDRSSGSFYQKTAVTNTFPKGQWTHFAWTRSGSGSNNNTIWINGISVAQFTGTLSYTDGQDFFIGGNDYSRTGTPNGYGFNGNISNVRITKGQAIYTSAFKPSYEPLTTTTGGATASNVKVICCNNSSITGSSLTSGTITSTNTPTASTDSPFDDPAGFVFGDAEDQNVIKCGSYVGNGSSTGPEINLGFEPQWILIKNTAGANWAMFDSMRGITTGGNDGLLYPSGTWEEDQLDFIDLTSTGFKVTNSDATINGNGNTIIYMCIRRPDGYVGKPPELGTGVFAMDVANGSTPSFISNFPVDWALLRMPATANNWSSSARLSPADLQPDNANSEDTSINVVFKKDHNNGWAVNRTSPRLSWMWKRHAGFDVVAYKGGGASSAPRSIPHSLSKPPEMIWTKNRDSSVNWVVWHKDLNGGGNNAVSYYLNLNLNNGQTSNGDIYGGANGVLPTSTHYTTGGNNQINESGSDFLAMLFSSVSGISSVGSYSGQNSNKTITLGFQPRFFIAKSLSGGAGNDWALYDSERGISGSSTQRIYLNSSSAQSSGFFINSVSSTGITLRGNISDTNQSGVDYVYYAHA